MKFTIDIDCNNAAFDSLGAELSHILGWLARELQWARPVNTLITLRDSNGNRVGTAELSTKE